MRRTFENRTGGAAERVDERPLVSGGLHGGRIEHVRPRVDIHDNGYIRAAVVVPVRHNMGDGRAGSVQKQRLSVR